MPKASRFRVTLITGGIATVAGMFPAITMRLLDFVALYGLLLMPMGAVIFVDFWLIRKFGLQSYYAERSGAALQLGRRRRLAGDAGHRLYPGQVRRPADFLRVATRLVHRRDTLHRLERGLSTGGPPGNRPDPKSAPEWHRHRRDHMRTAFIVISVLSLVVLMAPSILFLAGRMELDTVKWVMLAATVVWFAAAPPWLWKQTG